MLPNPIGLRPLARYVCHVRLAGAGGLDRMLGGNDAIRVEAVAIGEKSTWGGRSLREIDIQGKTGLIPVCLKHPENPQFTYNPSRMKY